MKPILFNTEMVRAISADLKTVTRRVVKGVGSDFRFIELEQNPDTVAIRKDGTEYPKRVNGLYACFASDIDAFPLVDVAACNSAAEAAEIMRREVYQIMGELASYQYDPDKYADRVRERMKWEPEFVEAVDE